MLNEVLFTIIEEKDIGNIWFHLVAHSRSYSQCFEDRIADVVWPHRKLRFDTVGLFFVGCRHYAGNPETIDALKDNIPKANEIIFHY